jgi:adenylate cyclase
MASTRQLAAIMFTDIVGYTALMGEDEQKAFDLLRKNRELQKPLIEQYNGRWIKELGDGILVSFPTVTDAVACAAAIQTACNEANDFKLRIGIHQGEVVFENDDVFGDGVNIASRLQALAPVGGTWVSEAVYKNVSNKKEITTRFVREEVLKNVKEPVRIYEIATKNADTPSGQYGAANPIHSRRKLFSGDKNKFKLLFVFSLTVFLLATIVLGYWFYNNNAAKQIRSIAVMPFVNETKSTDLEYLSDGMTETLISALSQLPAINVKPRSSVFRYKGKASDAQMVGKELNVHAVLNGTMVRRGEILALHIELVDAEKEKVLWSEDYTQPMSNLVSMQNEITRDVSQKIKLKISGAEEQKLAKNYTANSEAYQLYLKGRYHWNRRTDKDAQKAIDYFQQAIALDPKFALAYAGLADSYALFLGNAPQLEKNAKAGEAARKAVNMDDDLAEAHTAYARVLTVNEYDFTNAEREFRRAIELNPIYAVTYERYSLLLVNQGRWEESLAQIRQALAIEPLNLNFLATYGYVFLFARRYDEAIAQLKKTLELDANFHLTHNFLSYAYWLNGNYAQSVEERARATELNGDSEKAVLIRKAFAKEGWKGFLQFMTNEPVTPATRFYSIALYYGALGEKDKAFAALTRSYENCEPLIALLNVDPRLDALRKDGRFQELVKRVGFK